jgi:hypothetical protein
MSRIRKRNYRVLISVIVATLPSIIPMMASPFFSVAAFVGLSCPQLRSRLECWCGGPLWSRPNWLEPIDSAGQIGLLGRNASGAGGR